MNVITKLLHLFNVRKALFSQFSRGVSETSKAIVCSTVYSYPPKSSMFCNIVWCPMNNPTEIYDADAILGVQTCIHHGFRKRILDRIYGRRVYNLHNMDRRYKSNVFVSCHPTSVTSRSNINSELAIKYQRKVTCVKCTTCLHRRIRRSVW